MEVVLDSVIINHLLRTPKSARTGEGISTVLDRYIEGRSLAIGIDPDDAIIHEWKRTAGAEYVQVLVVHWLDVGGLFHVEKLGRLSPALAKKLRLLGFDGTIDKLLVKVALALKDKTVVSIDSDFWNPAKPKEKRWVGNRNAPVAKLLREALAVTVLTLEMLLGELASAQLT